MPIATKDGTSPITRPQEHPAVIQAQQTLSEARTRLAHAKSEYERLYRAQDSSDRLLASEAVLKLPGTIMDVRHADLAVRRAERALQEALEVGRNAARAYWLGKLREPVLDLIAAMTGEAFEKNEVVRALVAQAQQAGVSFSPLHVPWLEQDRVAFFCEMARREAGLPPV
jgi:hypothetical protein